MCINVSSTSLYGARQSRKCGEPPQMTAWNVQTTYIQTDSQWPQKIVEKFVLTGSLRLVSGDLDQVYRRRVQNS